MKIKKIIMSLFQKEDFFESVDQFAGFLQKEMQERILFVKKLIDSIVKMFPYVVPVLLLIVIYFLWVTICPENLLLGLCVVLLALLTIAWILFMKNQLYLFSQQQEKQFPSIQLDTKRIKIGVLIVTDNDEKMATEKANELLPTVDRLFALTRLDTHDACKLIKNLKEVDLILTRQNKQDAHNLIDKQGNEKKLDLTSLKDYFSSQQDEENQNH